MRLKRYALIAGLAGLAMAAGPTMAATVIDGITYELPDTAATNLDGVRALIATANGVGMMRRSAASAKELTMWTTTARFEFSAAGLFNGQQVDALTIGFDYKLPAVRIDVTAGDRRTVSVARGDQVWDESEPGVFAGEARTSPEEAAERLLPIWLMPTAVTVAGSLAWDKVRLVNRAGDYEVTLPSGDVMLVDVDGFSRPSTIIATIGGKQHVLKYSDYTNDKMDYHVYFPSHIEHSIDGQVVSDLTVIEHWVEPYLIFPAPGEY